MQEVLDEQSTSEVAMMEPTTTPIEEEDVLPKYRDFSIQVAPSCRNVKSQVEPQTSIKGKYS